MAFRTGKQAQPKYPNRLRLYLRGYKVARLARDTDIPERSLWEMIGERARIPEEKLAVLATCLQCLPEQLLSGDGTVYWNIPHQRNIFFTGREALLNRMHQLLHKNTIVAVTQMQALCGLGGIGKSQTALEYAYRHSHDYTAIFWVKADTRENLLSDFLALAVLLRLPERDANDQAVTITAIHRWLREQKAWLLIFDNADDLTLVRDILPTGYQGHVLITTRAQAMGRLARRVEVEMMDQDVGTLFLLRRAEIIAPEMTLQDASEQDRKLATELVNELGGLPLALDQAAAYVEETASGLADYLALYRTQRLALLSKRGGIIEDHPEPVTTTWSISFAKIEQSSPVAAELLRVCAFLDPDAIPEELLTDGAGALGPELVALVTDRLLLNEAMSVLRKYSLIRRNLEIRMLSLHRLVQVVLKDGMHEDRQAMWAERVVRAVDAVFPAKIEVGMWDRCQRLLPQALLCTTLVNQFGFTFGEASHLLNQVAYYLRERARYQEAEMLYQQALALRRQQLGEIHLETAQSCYNLARLYFDTARYEEAEALYRQALVIQRKLLGNEQVMIAQTLNSIALTLWRWRVRYDEAEQLYEQALMIFDQTVGREHQLTAHCVNNMALLQLTLAHYAEAERLNQQVLAIRERLLPAIHLDTAQSLQNLACVYVEQGNQAMYSQAEQLLQRSLEIREHLLGPDHPQTARSLHNLAILYEAQGRYKEAEQLYKQVLTIREKSLGTENEMTMVAREAYVALQRQLGQRSPGYR